MMDTKTLFRKACLLPLLALLFLTPETCAAQDIGYLWVTSQPKYALVYLNAQYVDTTPISKWISVEPGQYTIALSKAGYKLYEDKIIIESGKGLSVSISLAERGSEEPSKLVNKRYAEAYITIRSEPSGADVYLDDKLIGKTFMTEREIQPGEPEDRKLRIVKPGYKPHEETIKWTDMRDKIKIHVSVELEPLKQAVGDSPPVRSKFIVNTYVIALFILLLVVIAILTTRIVIRLRQRD